MMARWDGSVGMGRAGQGGRLNDTRDENRRIIHLGFSSSKLKDTETRWE